MRHFLNSLITFWVGFYVFGGFAHATSPVQLEIFDIGVTSQDFGENYKVTETKKELPFPSILPDRAKRDLALKSSGVLAVERYQKMEGFEKDLIFLNAKKKTLAELRKIYPDLNVKVLKKFKAEVSK